MMTLMTGGVSWTRVRLPRILSTIYKAHFATASFVAALVFALESDVLRFASMWLGMLGALSWVLLVVSFILSMTESWQVGEVDVDATALVVRARNAKPRVIPKSAIVGAMVVMRVAGTMTVPTVEVELQDGDRVAMRLGDLATARAVVTELGFGPRQQRSRTRLAKPSRRLFHLLAGFVLYAIFAVASTASMIFARGSGSLVGFTAQAVGPLVILLLFLLIKRRIRPPEATIGDDGVLVEAGTSRAFFRPNDPRLVTALRGAACDDDRIASALHVAAERNAVASGDVAAARGDEGAMGNQAPTLLANGAFQRRGRSFAEWRAHLASLMDHGGYRTRATTAEEATAILSSARATPDERVGAAIVLRAMGEPAEKLRIAAEATAHEQVRVALQGVVDGEDEAALRALERAEKMQA